MVVNISTSTFFEVLIVLVVVANIAAIFMQLVLRPFPGTATSKAFAFINAIFVMVYFTEFLMKVLVTGFGYFIKCHWHKLIVIVLFIAFVDLIIDLVNNFMYPPTMEIFLAALIFLLLRTIRFVKLLKVSISPCFLAVDRYINSKLCHAFEIEKSFINGEEEVLEVLKHMIYNQEAANKIKEKLKNNIFAMERKIGEILKLTPAVEVTVYTRQAIAGTFIHLKEGLRKMKSKGLLDELEFAMLNDIKRMRMMHLKTHFEMVAMTDFPTLLRTVPWISGNEELANAIEIQSEVKNFTYADIILRPGKTDKLFIILTGTAKVRYEPTNRIIYNLNTYGAVPNIDYFRTLDFHEPQEHTITAGNVVGEMALLTSGIYDATVSCDGAVEALMVSTEEIEITIEIEEQIWKSVASRIAPLILHSVPAYMAWNTKTLLTLIERAFILKLESVKKFTVTNDIREVILIKGMARDEVSGEVFHGPTYIPRTVHKLEDQNLSSLSMEFIASGILFVIPEEGTEMEAAMGLTDSKSVQKLRESLRRRTLISSQFAPEQMDLHTEIPSGTISAEQTQNTSALPLHEEPL